jgi:hypothetical protein
MAAKLNNIGFNPFGQRPASVTIKSDGAVAGKSCPVADAVSGKGDIVHVSNI